MAFVTPPAGSPLPGAPAIVIFGAAVRADGSPSGALRRRVEAAARFGQRLQSAGQHPLYVPTGGIGRHGDAEAAVMTRLLGQLGVPATDILPDPASRDTVASVRAVRRLLAGRTGTVFAATDRYHLPRCVVLLWLAGLKAWPATPPPGPAARDTCRRWYWRLREIPALPWDAAYVVLLRLLRKL